MGLLLVEKQWLRHPLGLGLVFLRIGCRFSKTLFLYRLVYACIVVQHAMHQKLHNGWDHSLKSYWLVQGLMIRCCRKKEIQTGGFLGVIKGALRLDCPLIMLEDGEGRENDEVTSGQIFMGHRTKEMPTGGC
jgi:hypothetical protein